MIFLEVVRTKFYGWLKNRQVCHNKGKLGNLYLWICLYFIKEDMNSVDSYFSRDSFKKIYIIFCDLISHVSKFS